MVNSKRFVILKVFHLPFTIYYLPESFPFTIHYLLFTRVRCYGGEANKKEQCGANGHNSDSVLPQLHSRAENSQADGAESRPDEAQSDR
jgi:hypothetical protein